MLSPTMDSIQTRSETALKTDFHRRSLQITFLQSRFVNRISLPCIAASPTHFCWQSPSSWEPARGLLLTFITTCLEKPPHCAMDTPSLRPMPPPKCRPQSPPATGSPGCRTPTEAAMPGCSIPPTIARGQPPSSSREPAGCMMRSPPSHSGTMDSKATATGSASMRAMITFSWSWQDCDLIRAGLTAPKVLSGRPEAALPMVV